MPKRSNSVVKIKKPPLGVGGLARSDTNKSHQMLTSLSNSFCIDEPQPRRSLF